MSFLSVLMMQVSDSPIFVVDIGDKHNKLRDRLPGELIPFNYENTCLIILSFQTIIFYTKTDFLP